MQCVELFHSRHELHLLFSLPQGCLLDPLSHLVRAADLSFASQYSASSLSKMLSSSMLQEMKAQVGLPGPQECSARQSGARQQTSSHLLCAGGASPPCCLPRGPSTIQQGSCCKSGLVVTLLSLLPLLSDRALGLFHQHLLALPGRQRASEFKT